MKEHSFGIVPVQKNKDEWFVLLVQHRAGHWSFPKGKKEAGETALQAAERELFEETHYTVERYIEETPFCEAYSFLRGPKKVVKQVTYFLATVQGELIIQPEELIQARWIRMNEAFSYLTFPQAKEILSQAQKFLN